MVIINKVAFLFRSKKSDFPCTKSYREQRFMKIYGVVKKLNRFSTFHFFATDLYENLSF